ncbi:MAG: energy transducer TonB, partial [Flavobacterium sp.]|nr:energy transducer TonB [Flavobacterium sp.]
TMKNVSIYGKKWLDIIFEQKNKEYGAYQLRKNDEKTTLKAFFSAVIAICLILTAMVFFTSFADKPEELKIVLIRPVSPDIFKIKTEEPIVKKNLRSQKSVTKQKVYKSAPMQIVPQQQAVDFVPTNNEIKSSPTNSDAGSVNLLGVGTTSGTATLPEVTNPNGIETSDNVDTKPSFPGGIERFYIYVGRTFNKPEYDEPTTIKLLVQFVIERDGALSNIVVLSKTNDNLNNEAIRVLKSLKIKWNAGIKDGQTVRTQYTLPITVMSE